MFMLLLGVLAVVDDGLVPRQAHDPSRRRNPCCCLLDLAQYFLEAPFNGDMPVSEVVLTELEPFMFFFANQCEGRADGSILNPIFGWSSLSLEMRLVGALVLVLVGHEVG